MSVPQRFLRPLNSPVKVFRVLRTVFLPIPKNDDVVSQPVSACTAGKMPHSSGVSKA